jgi:hypothetical protein
VLLKLLVYSDFPLFSFDYSASALTFKPVVELRIGRFTIGRRMPSCPTNFRDRALEEAGLLCFADGLGCGGIAFGFEGDLEI